MCVHNCKCLPFLGTVFKANGRYRRAVFSLNRKRDACRVADAVVSSARVGNGHRCVTRPRVDHELTTNLPQEPPSSVCRFSLGNEKCDGSNDRIGRQRDEICDGDETAEENNVGKVGVVCDIAHERDDLYMGVNNRSETGTGGRRAAGAGVETPWARPSFGAPTVVLGELTHKGHAVAPALALRPE